MFFTGIPRRTFKFHGTFHCIPMFLILEKRFYRRLNVLRTNKKNVILRTVRWKVNLGTKMVLPWHHWECGIFILKCTDAFYPSEMHTAAQTEGLSGGKTSLKHGFILPHMRLVMKAIYTLGRQMTFHCRGFPVIRRGLFRHWCSYTTSALWRG